MSEYATVPEAAKILGVTQQAINARIKRKTLPAVRMGWMWLIRKSDLERYQ